MSPLVAHLVGDFILQNEWMASNKKHRSFACLVHVLVYLLPFLLSCKSNRPRIGGTADVCA